jgi:hypothetical protein
LNEASISYPTSIPVKFAGRISDSYARDEFEAIKAARDRAMVEVVLFK